MRSTLTDRRLVEKQLTIYFEDRIDASNAPRIEKELQELLQEHSGKFEALILDFEDTVYISSAGLRVILRTKRMYNQFKIINVSSEVYEILDMTGFTQMMTIEKAYRKINIDGCDVIGEGANGKIYRIDAETIVKVYNSVDSVPDIKREQDLARLAFVNGIPTAISYDVVKVGDQFGSVFELLEAKSFAKLMASDKEHIDHYITLYTDLVKTLHETEIFSEKIPDMKDIALSWGSYLDGHMDESDHQKLMKLLEEVPEDHHVLHGDYHLKNIMMQGDEVMLIDMDTLSTGDPVYEFGSIWLAYQGFPELDHRTIEKFMGITYEMATKIWHDTLKLYFNGKTEEELLELEKRAKVIGYMRNLRRTLRRYQDTENGNAIIENCKLKLHELLQDVETLSMRKN